MVRFPVLLLASAALMTPALAAAQTQSAISQQATGPVITLSVTESVDSAPDMATINTGVQNRSMSAKEAMTQNAAQMDKLIAALLKGGIARKDIQTSGINLNPQYDYSSRTDGQGPRFVGYEASNQLTVKVRKIAAAGELVDAMVAAGATNINGPSFGLSDPATVLDQARAKAVQTAQSRAELYARSLGYKSVRLVALSESGGFAPPPMPMMAMRSDAIAVSASKIEPGELSSSITLNVQYALER